MKPLNEQFMKQAEEFMASAKDARLPETFQALTHESVTKTREALDTAQKVAKSTGKEYETVADTYAKGAKALNKKLMDTAAANTAATLDAVEAIAESKTIPEAARLQADFVQQHMTQTAEQTRDIMEHTQKLMKDTFDKWNSATVKAFEKMQTAAK